MNDTNKAYRLKAYELDTEMNFGKYRGEIIYDIASVDPGYIEWCILHLDHFFIDQFVMEILKDEFPRFELSADAYVRLEQKGARWRVGEGGYNRTDERGYDRVSQDELEMGDWDYDPDNPAHDAGDNPWIDVFGAGEEAEAAYWNTH